MDPGALAWSCMMLGARTALPFGTAVILLRVPLAPTTVSITRPPSSTRPEMPEGASLGPTRRDWPIGIASPVEIEGRGRLENMFRTA